MHLHIEANMVPQHVMPSPDPLEPKLPSLNSVLKQLKRESSSLYNSINSVLADAAFVSQIRALYPALPLFANLRCGVWYASQSEGTCYFKSTDGHHSNWQFSCIRLNWHLGLAAARSGGCLVVDATRRGKTYPVNFLIFVISSHSL